jgi:predicted RNA methylase
MIQDIQRQEGLMSSLMPAIEYASTAVGYRSPARYVARARFLFDAVDLHGKRVLEVGCGRGAWVVWAALHGASHVLGLEPEADTARAQVVW